MKLTISIVLVLITTCSFGQTQQSGLVESILTNDSLIFEEAFNRCNFQEVSTLISDDFEFYHDQHGITYGKINFINSIKNNICSLPYRPRRELVKESSFVYPLLNGNEIYGAIQNGKHRFFAKEKDREEYFTSIADFSHLWILDKGKFKLKRVFSYNHQSIETAGVSEISWAREQIEDWLQANKVPCLGLGIIHKGKLTDTKVYGELESGKKAPYNTIFNVASLTKPIVSMTVLKLVDSGKWDLAGKCIQIWEMNML